MAELDVPGVGPTPSKRVAIAGGALVAIVGFVWWRRKSAAAAAAATDPNAAAATDGTGLGTAASGMYDSTPVSSYTNPITGYSTPLDNASWVQQAVSAMQNLGYDPILVTETLGVYLTGHCLTDSQASIVNAAIGYMGPAPVGSYTVTICPGAAPPPAPKPPAPPPPAPGGGGGAPPINPSAYYPLSPTAAWNMVNSGKTVYQSGAEAIAWAKANHASYAGINPNGYYPLSHDAAVNALLHGHTLYQSGAEAAAWAAAHG